MTTVIIKKKNRRLVKKTIAANPYPIATPEMFKIFKELKKLVPNKNKRMAVISLAKSKFLSFDDALQIINNAENEFEVQKAQEKLVIKERRKCAKKSRKMSLKFAAQIPSTYQTRNKLWVSFVSGGGGPGTGKRR